MLLVKIGLIEINHKLLEKNRFKEERRSKKKIRAAKRLWIKLKLYKFHSWPIESKNL